jgi:pimeloyl-ACP methyl ester carboxylesterase
MEASMQCSIRDLDIYYEETGAGRPLLALHGMPLDHRHIMEDLEPLFAQRTGWRRIYPDIPGMGQTHAPDWLTSQDQVLDIILEFIEQVAPHERIVVAGTSYGGYLARGIVHHRPGQVDGLMLNGPSVRVDQQQRVLPTHRVIHEDPDFLAALQPSEQGWLDVAVVQSLALLDSARRVIDPAGGLADSTFLDRLDAHFAFSFEVDALPQPLAAPTLMLTGRFDPWVGYHEAYHLLDNFPRATYAVLDRAGHALALEQKTLFRALVSEWLDRVEEYALENAHGSGKQ